MHSLIKGAALVGSLLMAAPAFAQSYGPYGPGYGYGYDPGYSYGPNYDYSPQYQGPAYGAPVYGGPMEGGPVYEGRSVAVDPEQSGAGPGPGDSVAFCESHFRSYNPETGTYVGYDGVRRSCP